MQAIYKRRESGGYWGLLALEKTEQLGPGLTSLLHHGPSVVTCKALLAAAEPVRRGGMGSSGGEALAAQVRDAIVAAGGRVDYIDVVDARTLRPVADVTAQPTLVAVAALFGTVRLIDNIEI